MQETWFFEILGIPTPPLSKEKGSKHRHLVPLTRYRSYAPTDSTLMVQWSAVNPGKPGNWGVFAAREIFPSGHKTSGAGSGGGRANSAPLPRA